MLRFLPPALAALSVQTLAAGPVSLVLAPGASAEITLEAPGADSATRAWVRGEFVSLPPPAPPAALAREAAVDWSPPHAADRLLIRWAPGAAGPERAAALRRHGLRSLHRFRLIEAELVALPAGTAARAAAGRLVREAAVVRCEPDLRIAPFGAGAEEPRFDEQWGLHNVGSLTGAVPGADVDALGAWEFTEGSPEVVIAVIDTGVNYLHPEFGGQIWLNAGELGDDGMGGQRQSNGLDDDGNGYIDDVFGYDFADDDTDPMAAAFEGGHHGTVVAGVIAALADNGEGIAGLAPLCRLMPLKIFPDALPPTQPGNEPFYLGDAMEAIEYAALMGADVLCCAWGDPNDLLPWTEGTITMFRELVQETAEMGLLMAAATGGNNIHLDGVSHLYPATLPEPSILAVGASSWDDGGWYADINFGANYGEEVDLSAPGDLILGPTRGSGYVAISGSSVATPFAAAAAGLLLAENPWAGWPELRRWLLGSVDTPAALAENPRDPGVPFNATDGRLNAHSALLISGPPWLRAAADDDQITVTVMTVDESVGLSLASGEVWTARVLWGDPASPASEEIVLTVGEFVPGLVGVILR